jgi:hypothetical protein
MEAYVERKIDGLIIYMADKVEEHTRDVWLQTTADDIPKMEVSIAKLEATANALGAILAGLKTDCPEVTS